MTWTLFFNLIGAKKSLIGPTNDVTAFRKYGKGRKNEIPAAVSRKYSKRHNPMHATVNRNAPFPRWGIFFTYLPYASG